LVISSSQSALYRKLPSVNEVLREPAIVRLIEDEGLPSVTDATRQVLDRLRIEISDGRLHADALELALQGLSAAIERQVDQASRYSLRPVINATGVILHTNLGRAPLSDDALDHIREIASAYSNLEFDLETGRRSRRDVHVDRLFRKLLQAGESEMVSTIVVNNNAAAVLLALNTLAEGGEAIVSRGELVEIGGSFRIPDVMAKSLVTLREVGTTNRTRIADYEHAINEKTKLLLRVHRSNFEMTGFTEQPSLESLVELARAKNIPLMEDLGGGALFDLRIVGVADEPGVLDSLRVGVNVVAYSGDKLLGGPQAGMLSGREDLIARMRSNPLFRALRVDKLTYAALEATLLAYVRRDYEAIPALRMMQLSSAEIGARAEVIVSAWTSQIKSSEVRAEVIDGDSLIGGGAAPSATLPTRLIALSSASLTADELSIRLRSCDPSIVARVEDGHVLIDLRTVFPDQDSVVVQALRSLGRQEAS